MNRKLLALAVTAALAAPLAAQAAPTVYGQLNLSVDAVDLETFDQEEVQVNSNSSRLGVKGEEALGNGYSAVYKAEWAVSGDVAGGSDLTGRDRYLGLKGNWGTVKLGAYDSPLKTSQGSVDVFNDMTYLDMGTFISGENRINNVIGYESPKIADVLTVNVAVQSGEYFEDAGANDADDDGVSASVVYQSGGLYLAAALDKAVADGVVQGFIDILGGPTLPSEVLARDAIRVTGVYTMDALQLGALIQTSEISDEDLLGGSIDEESVLLSAAYTAGKNVFKGQFVMSTFDVGGGEIEANALMLGVDHNMTQSTKVFAQLGLSTLDAGGPDDDSNNVLSVGMQTKF